MKELLAAEADYAAYFGLYEARLSDDSIKIPKALDANFYDAKTKDEKRILALINEYEYLKTKQHEAGLFKQKKRLADAERKLKTQETKKALSDQRIATDKIEWHLKKIADLKRREPKERDSRIFPMWYAPVVIVEDGKRVIKPMRYMCRPSGKPASIDSLRTLYNARRDNLDKFWKKEFAHTRGIAIMHGFYENVALHDYEHREKREGEKESTVVLHFNPKPQQDMLVACLWSHWKKGKEDLYSFAAITDEPPPEIAATGHDRCIIPLKLGNISSWLKPEDSDFPTMYKLLDDRERPHYQHALAA